MKPYHYSFNPEEISGSVLDELLALGWFRMHQSIFTSSHIGLDDIYRVHWLRYAVNEIRKHDSHRKISARVKNFRHTIEDLTAVREDHARLHMKYRAFIDFDGAWSIEECLFGEAYPVKNIYDTKCISVFDGDKLIAGGYFDMGDQSAASILHFFDPDYSRYSLGKYLILLTIDYLKSNHCTFYYPGYVVEGVSKMNYKLFLGKEQAQYFDPETVTWKYFTESILIKQPSDRSQLLS